MRTAKHHAQTRLPLSNKRWSSTPAFHWNPPACKLNCRQGGDTGCNGRGRDNKRQGRQYPWHKIKVELSFQRPQCAEPFQHGPRPSNPWEDTPIQFSSEYCRTRDIDKAITKTLKSIRPRSSGNDVNHHPDNLAYCGDDVILSGACAFFPCC